MHRTFYLPANFDVIYVCRISCVEYLSGEKCVLISQLIRVFRTRRSHSKILDQPRFVMKNTFGR